MPPPRTLRRLGRTGNRCCLKLLRAESGEVVDLPRRSYNADSSAAFELVSPDMPDPSPTRSSLEITSAHAPSAPSDDSPRKIHLVEGSGQGLTGEVCGVLRMRLRMAAILLAGGLVAFLVYYTIRMQFDTTLKLAAYIMHWIATIACVYAAVSLCRRCPHSHAKLRFFEFAIFGVVAALFAIGQYAWTVTYAEQSVLNRNMSTWYVLMFTYALLIPNTWRNALPVLLTFTAAPVVMTLVALVSSEAVRRLITAEPGYFIELSMASVVTFGVAIVGVHSIYQLRTEAYEARQIGQYRLKRLLGSGGMGEVYLAEHRLMKRPCAIKLIRADKAGDPKTLARFEREVRATARLSHWNTIDIFDYGRTDDGTFYYVMEYLPGMNLNELVTRFGPMPADRAVYLVRQACDALTEAHKLDLVHRDIKPANIFAAIRGGYYDVVKLLDFGLAKPMHTLDGAGITQEGLITGSPLFMSPEQATGDREPDVRSDIYSLGAVMYFMLTGRPPFEYDKPMKVIVAHAHEIPQPIGELVDNVPDDVQQIVMRCLEKNPDDRYQRAEHLVLALESSSAARGWNRAHAAEWWSQRSTGEAGPIEPSIPSGDLSMTHDSAATTKA